MASVVFDAAAFKVRYPEFSSVSDARLLAFFNEATLYLSNTDTSIVQDLTRRAQFLNMLTAHVAALAGVLSADGLPLPVGRISSGSEGSVSSSLEYQAEPGSQAWYLQTQYGASYWQATKALRGFRYFANPTRY